MRHRPFPHTRTLSAPTLADVRDDVETIVRGEGAEGAYTVRVVQARARDGSEGLDRAVLDVLADRTAPVDVEDLAVAVAERETDEGGAVEEVMLTLHHTHLPMLTDFGVIDYDPEGTRVEVCRRRPHP